MFNDDLIANTDSGVDYQPRLKRLDYLEWPRIDVCFFDNPRAFFSFLPSASVPRGAVVYVSQWVN